MNTLTESKIDKLLEDLSSIKTVINRNKPLLQQIVHPARFRMFSLVAGLDIIGICLVLFFIIQHYGSFAEIPKTGKMIIYAALAVDLIVMQIYKHKTFLTSARKIDPKLTVMGMLKEILSFRIIHIYLPVVGVIVYLGFYFSHHNMAYYIVPAIAIGVGLLYNLMGSITHIRYYLIIGYWTLLTGALAIVFTAIHPLIVFAISLGGGILLMGLTGFLPQAINTED